MALSEFYESTIIKVVAHFGFHGFEEDPDDITSVIGIEPDEVRRKGQFHEIWEGKGNIIEENDWTISSKSCSKDVNVHIRELLSRLENKDLLVQANWNAWNGKTLTDTFSNSL